MKFIEMKQEHAEEVIAMMREFYASTAVSTNGSEEIFLSDVENCIGDSPYLDGYVFVEGDIIAGYGMIAKSFSTEFGKPCIWIEDIYLKADYRGRGAGSEFLLFIGQKYKEAVIRLEVEEDNKPAVHVYKKCGFGTLPYREMIKGHL